MVNVDVKNIVDLRAGVAALSKAELEELVVDIALRLCFDEHGEYNPEESLAADSGADFVESVTYTFHRNGISL